MTVLSYLALGSNVGVREQYLREAIQALTATPGIKLIAVSKVFETDPVGYVEQDAFLNMVIAIETELSPTELLEHVLSIEQTLGRVRLIRWGPRVIDIDIILYGNEQIDLPNLQIPHPAMKERAFVLVPLRDVWQGGTFLGTESMEEYIHQTGDAKGVRIWGTLDLDTGSAPTES